MILFIKKDRPRLQQNRPAPSSAKKTGSIFSQKDRLLQQKRPAPSSQRQWPQAAATATGGCTYSNAWTKKTSSVFSKKDRLRLQQKRPAPSSAKKDQLRLQQKNNGSVFSKKKTRSVFSKKARLRLQQKDWLCLQQKRPAPSSAKKTGSVLNKKDWLRLQQKNTGYLRMPTYSSRLSGFRSDTWSSLKIAH